MTFSTLVSVLRTVCTEHFYRLRHVYSVVSFVLVVVLGAWFFLYSAPSDFPSETTKVTIQQGSTLAEVGDSLEEQSVIRSSLLFVLLTKVFSNEFGVQAGTYVFSRQYDLGTIVYRVTHGLSDMVVVTVTIPEGSTVRDMRALFEKKFSDFDGEVFTEKAIAYEGYLFPDTYTFMPDATVDDIILRLRETFAQKTFALQSNSALATHTFTDTIIMASLIEREARTLEEKKIISGILWKRIKIGMPLQVDAVFGYIKNQDTYNPSFKDLEIESPYNTYRNKGLPPGPISNPGMESITAAFIPTETEYLYYLTGTDGKMYYAKTFEEHKANRAKYLD